MRLGRLFLALAGVGAAYAQEPITFKGVPLGSTPAALQAALPGLQCRGNFCGIDPAASCRARAPGDDLDRCLGPLTYGGQVPKLITATYSGGKLVTVTIHLDVAAFPALIDALRHKFGAPETDNRATPSASSVEALDNHRLGWRSGDTLLLATKRTRTSTAISAVSITSLRHLERTIRERQQKAKEAHGDL